MKKISKGNLVDLVALMAENQQVYLPVKANGETNYARYTEGAEVDIDTLKTVKSAKEVFHHRLHFITSIINYITAWDCLRCEACVICDFIFNDIQFWDTKRS